MNTLYINYIYIYTRMVSNLVIVESPGKIATITKYLNENPSLKKYGTFVVMASVGHIRDLVKKKLAIDIDNNFEPEYEFSQDKKKVIESLKKEAKKCSHVYLAADNDKEGVFIADSVRLALNLGQNYKRIVFTEISSKALQYAIEHAGKINQNQLDAQVARRTLDRLVGFKISPVLWKKFSTATNLSAGRVQSAVLHLIIEKESDVQNFKSTSYWYYTGNFGLKVKGETKYSPLNENVKLYYQETVHKDEDENSVKKLFKNLKNDFVIRNVKTRETRQKPELPFITSSLQQEAGFPIKRTMQLAQELYEAGHITYMRTDSYNISEDFQKDARELIRLCMGRSSSEMLPM